MTVTLAGGDELFTALVSVQVGTLGGHFKQEWEGAVKRFVGGHLENLSDTRRKPELPFFPFYTSATEAHSVHTKYESLFCVFRQGKKWFEAISTSDEWGTNVLSTLPQEFVIESISESIDPEHGNTKVTAVFAFPDPV